MPNPTDNTTTVAVDVPQSENVSLVLFNVLGQSVMTLLQGPRERGEYQVDVPMAALPPGQYYLRLQAGGETRARIVVLER